MNNDEISNSKEFRFLQGIYQKKKKLKLDKIRNLLLIVNVKFTESRTNQE